MEHRRMSLVGPTLLIGLGVILLLSNLGILNWSIWDVLQLWPVILIAAGLELLLGSRSVWGSFVAALLVLALIVGGVVLVEQAAPIGTRGEVIEISHPIDGAETFILDLDPAVVNLIIESLDDSANLVEGTVQGWNREEPNQRFTGGERARLVLSTDSRQGIGTITMGRAASWRLRVSPDVRTELNADFGVGEAYLRLAELAVDEADISFGIGRVELALSEGISGDLAVDGGIGSIRIVVPRGMGLRIRADAGLVTRNIPSRYTREGETYTSPNWDAATHRTTLTLNLGIGTITVVESGGE